MAIQLHLGSRRVRRTCWRVAGVLATATIADIASAQCAMEWTNSADYLLTGVEGRVQCSCVWMDGAGQALYIGGSFNKISGLNMLSIARWDGYQWSSLGPGLNGTVQAIASFDDGHGPALFAGGLFSLAGNLPVSHIAKWKDGMWSSITPNFAGSVNALAVFDDGTGPALYVGGSFSTIGGIPAANIAKWNGTTWSALGTGLNQSVSSLLSTTVAGAPALCVGGTFTTAGGQSANRIAVWNGGSWSTLGQGITGLVVNVMATYDDGVSNKLYAGGIFTMAGNVSAVNLACWNGTQWSGVRTGIGSPGSDEVRALTVFDDGSGSQLYIGGSFSFVNGQNVNKVVRWNGVDIASVGSGLQSTVYTLTAFQDSFGARLYAGGDFTLPNHLAKWTGQKWVAPGRSIDGPVTALATFDDGSGTKLCVGGQFATAGETNLLNIGLWDGASWTSLGNGVYFGVHAIAVIRTSGQASPSLFAAGTSNGQPVTGIGRWTGSAWEPLGLGVNGYVAAICEYDDGSGPVLCAAGDFTQAGGLPAKRIATWDGNAWHPLGAGFDSIVRALAVYNGPTGAELYAGGDFGSSGGAQFRSIARWDGTAWHDVGGPSVLGPSDVDGLCVFDDGAGSALYVGGSFHATIGSATLDNIARWDGSTWTAVGGGLNTRVNCVKAVTLNGRGTHLFAGGTFETTIPPSGFLNRISVFNGTAWTALDAGITGSGTFGGTSAGPTIFAIEGLSTPNGDTLYAGGTFWSAGAHVSHCLARWSCEQVNLCAMDVNGNGVVDIDDLVLVITNWGATGANPADVTRNGVVNIDDLVQVITHWGACP